MQFNNFITIGRTVCRTTCWGKAVHDSPSEVIVCIPGNPGLNEFYFPYLEELHAISNLPVWIVGHLGHEENDEDDVANKIVKDYTQYDLNDQLIHKLEFLKKFTNASTKIHLIGHSIGAWIVMEILKDNVLKQQIKTANLLFPTLQKMASSPNGFWIDKVARKITPLLLLVVYIFFLLPLFIRKFMVSTYFNIKSIRSSMLPVTLKYLRPSVIGNVLYMAYDEMDTVDKIDLENVKRNKSIIRIIHGKFDGWAPSTYFDEILNIPDLHIEEVEYEHAFVIHASEPVAALTNKFITKM